MVDVSLESLPHMPAFNSDWASPPGDLIEEYMEVKNITNLSKFAGDLGISMSDLARLFSGEMPISEQLAEKLSELFGTTKGFWLSLDSNYRSDLERIGNSPSPCPFCGSENVNVVEGSTSRWRVAECAECGARGPEGRWIYNEPDPDASARARVLKVWDTRA